MLGMNLLFDYNSSWYVLFFGFLAAWAVLLIALRKGPTKREAKEQVFLGLSGMLALGLMESFAVSTNLWHYTPGD
jgi:hypothetical protein